MDFNFNNLLEENWIPRIRK